MSKGSSGINRFGRLSKREHTTRSDRRTRFGYFLPALIIGSGYCPPLSCLRVGRKLLQASH